MRRSLRRGLSSALRTRLFAQTLAPLLLKPAVSFSPSSLLTSFSFCRSDADSDVLADYVIALLKHDGDAASVRALCEAEIPDFLTEGPLELL